MLNDSNVLVVFMQIGSSMDEAEFTQRVVPCVSKLFTSTDRSIRRSLLENIDAYGKHLSQVRPPVILPCKVHKVAWVSATALSIIERCCSHTSVSVLSRVANAVHKRGG